VLVGVTYGLLAYPISLIYVAKGTIDLAVGSSATLAGAVAMVMAPPLGFIVAIAVGVGAAGLVGWVSSMLAQCHRGDDLSSVLSSFGFALVLESLVLTLFGKDPMVRQQFSSFWQLFGVYVSPQAAVNGVVGLLILATVYGLLYRTPWGRVMRAAAVNPLGATLAGIPVAKTQWSAFLVSGVLAAIAGILMLYSSGLDFASGLPLTLKSLGAAIIFGLGKPMRGFLGGIAIGVIESLSVGFAPQASATLIPYVFIFTVLCCARMSRVGTAGLRA
jgi:branched-chain amino acid transport system permease protein